MIQDQLISEKENLEDIFPEYYHDKDLSDFLGNQHTIKIVNNIFLNILGSRIFSRMGTKPQKSFLFHGEKGTGKNRAVECIVGELWKKGICTGVKEYSIGKQGSHYVDMGSKNIQKFFEKGREILMEKEAHCLVYVFDEAEMIMRARGIGENKSDDKRLSTLMMNLQKIHKSDLPEFLFFMTNEPTLMDGASIRSERIDKTIEFTLPDYCARVGLFQYAIDKINEKAGYQVVRNYNLDELAELSEGFNCADCIEIPNRAVQDRVLKYLTERKSKRIVAGYVTKKGLLRQVCDQRQTYAKTTKKKIGF